MTKQFDNNKNIEFVSSGIADDWTEKNITLLRYSKIASEFTKIKKVQDSIAKGVYW